jgi:hypothetical protein
LRLSRGHDMPSNECTHYSEQIAAPRNSVQLECQNINGSLEALRRNALGFRNLTNYRRRSLLHSGALHQLVNAL